MSIGVTLSIIGLDALKKKLQEKNVTEPLNDGIKKATLLLDREVKQATVVDKGYARATVSSEIGTGFGQVGMSAEYGPILEWGSVYMEARHMEGGTKVLGEGMFAFGLRKLTDKMKDLLGDIANAIEARWK